MKKVLIVCTCVFMLCPIAAFAQGLGNRPIQRGEGWNRQSSTNQQANQRQESGTIPRDGDRNREQPNNQAPVIDLSRPIDDPATQAPPGHYRGERASDRRSVSRQAPAARYVPQDSQFSQNAWRSQTANSPTQNTTMNLDGERMNVRSMSKTVRTDSPPPSQPGVAYLVPPTGSFSDKISNVSVGPLKWTTSYLTPDQRQFLTNVRNAQRSGIIDVYTSHRQRIQFIEDPDGACVVYVSPNSRLRGRVAVGDVIMTMDGQPIDDPWEVELHYRWSHVEKMRWQDGAIRSFWVWLGTF